MYATNTSLILDPGYEGVINTIVNASMLQDFLTGLYTVLYGGTMYLLLYNTHKNQGRRVVVLAISILYAMYMGYWIIQWYYFGHGFSVTRGNQPKYVSIASFSGKSVWLSAINGFLFFMVFAVSDALLIWRCYHVWGASLRAIIIPLIFFLLEIGLIITTTILNIRQPNLGQSDGFTLFSNLFVSGLALSSAGTTVMTTFLIGYKIHTVTRLDGILSKNRFKYIVVMIIECAAISSINLLAVSILIFIDHFPNTARNTSFLVQMYLQSISGGISGMAPTILIARLAAKHGNTEQTSVLTFTPLHINELRFGSTRGDRDSSDPHQDLGPSVRMAETIYTIADEAVLERKRTL